jgi:hypothetical protein
MTKSALAMSREAALAGPAMYPDDVEPALQDALAVLADIDAHYDGERERLEAWLGPESVKRRLASELAEAHRQEREPHVRLLAELHRRWMEATGLARRYRLQ